MEQSRRLDSASRPEWTASRTAAGTVTDARAESWSAADTLTCSRSAASS
jgi:hypothetical protein